MPWRTYWPALALAVPLGGGLGALLGITIGSLMNWGSSPALLIFGALIGAVDAAAAAGGAIVAVSLSHRRPPSHVTDAAVAGATLGATVPWVLVVAFFAVTSGTAVIAAIVPAGVFAVVGAALAGVSCYALMTALRALRERRDRTLATPVSAE